MRLRLSNILGARMKGTLGDIDSLNKVPFSESHK